MLHHDKIIKQNKNKIRNGKAKVRTKWSDGL